MKIGIDIDGVIIDFERELKTYAELYDILELNNNNNKVRYDEFYIQNRYNWSEQQFNEFMKKYFLKITEISNLLPGAKEVIKLLHQEKHELIIITNRGQLNEEMIEYAERILLNNDLIFDKYYWKQKNKLNIAQKEKIDLMIDDSYEVCKCLSENCIKVLYFRDKNMKKLSESTYLKEVSNWGEIYRFIKNSVEV